MKSLVGVFKPAIKAIIPENLRGSINFHLANRWNAKFRNKPASEVFTAIYKEARWGVDPQQGFCSGNGSRDPAAVNPYVDAVSAFLRSLPAMPNVVDLGCGDFNVGIQLRPFCQSYIACDIVAELIEHHRTRFADAQVDFRRVDMIQDELPYGDVAILRQVLQHLTNSQILCIVSKLYRYKYLVLTEHLPIVPTFKPNLDKPAGTGVRLPKGSGIVLTAPPFNLNVESEQLICSSPQAIYKYAGCIATTVYTLGQDVIA